MPKATVAGFQMIVCFYKYLSVVAFCCNQCNAKLIFPVWNNFGLLFPTMSKQTMNKSIQLSKFWSAMTVRLAKNSTMSINFVSHELSHCLIKACVKRRGITSVDNKTLGWFLPLEMQLNHSCLSIVALGLLRPEGLYFATMCLLRHCRISATISCKWCLTVSKHRTDFTPWNKVNIIWLRGLRWS